MSDTGDILDAMDAWLQKQCAELEGPISKHVMRGGGLNVPWYQRRLGQHQAYMRMRSLVSGSKRSA